MKPNNQIYNKIHMFSKLLHIDTKYLDLQACKKLAHGGIKAFDDYMHVYQCEREEMHTLYSERKL